MTSAAPTAAAASAGPAGVIVLLSRLQSERSLPMERKGWAVWERMPRLTASAANNAAISGVWTPYTDAPVAEVVDTAC